MLAGDGDANLFTIAVFKFNKSSTADVLIPKARAKKSYRNKSEFVWKEVFVLRVYASHIDIVRGKNNDVWSFNRSVSDSHNVYWVRGSMISYGLPMKIVDKFDFSIALIKFWQHIFLGG